MTQIIGGYQADKLGGETVMTMAAIVWSMMTFWMPQLVYLLDFKNYPTFAVVVIVAYRIAYGAVQGTCFAIPLSLWAHFFNFFFFCLRHAFSCDG